MDIWNFFRGKIFYLKNMPKTNVLKCKISETNINIIMCCDIICHRLKCDVLIKDLGLRLYISTTQLHLFKKEHFNI
jgi:hypothetical protein